MEIEEDRKVGVPSGKNWGWLAVQSWRPIPTGPPNQGKLRHLPNVYNYGVGFQGFGLQDNLFYQRQIAKMIIHFLLSGQKPLHNQ